MRCVRARPSLAARWRHTNRDRSCEVCSCPYLSQWRSLREPWMREAWGAPSPDKPPRTLSVVGGGSAAGPSHSRTSGDVRLEAAKGAKADMDHGAITSCDFVSTP